MTSLVTTFFYLLTYFLYGWTSLRHYDIQLLYSWCDLGQDWRHFLNNEWEWERERERERERETTQQPSMSVGSRRRRSSSHVRLKSLASDRLENISERRVDSQLQCCTVHVTHMHERCRIDPQRERERATVLSVRSATGPSIDWLSAWRSRSNNAVLVRCAACLRSRAGNDGFDRPTDADERWVTRRQARGWAR